MHATPSGARFRKRTFSMPLYVDTMIETFSIVPDMRYRPFRVVGSDAAAGLGDAGDLGGELGRALGEQLVELLDRDA